MGRHTEQHKARLRSPRRSAITATLAVLAFSSLSLAVSQDSSAAAPKLPSTTTVKATPAAAGLLRNVHLVATVKILNLGGAVIFPTGVVTFSNPDVGVLGTAKVTPCAIVPCTASLDTTELPLGADVVNADWSGDNYGKPSHGSTAVAINLTSYSTTSSVVCQKGDDTCDVGLIRSADGGTWTDLFLDQAPPQNHTATESLGGTPLKCADLNAGALSTFADTPDVVAFKTLRYTVTNPTQAANLLAAFEAHPDYLGCYASNKRFTDGKTGGPAKLVLEPGGAVYEAPLPSCGAVDFAPPCFFFDADTDQYGGEHGGVNTVEVEWEHGTSTDPKFTG